MDHDYEFEQNYWGDCTNTFDEDQKHYVYAKYMGLQQQHYSFNANNKRIIDIGGGPTSMLLKCTNLKQGLVVDPIMYPTWTRQRYSIKNIGVQVKPGEELTEQGWDEVWIYNCMQHAEDPALIIANAFKAAPILRLFEWIDIPAHEGHPWELTEENLTTWIGSKGQIVTLQEHGCYGRAFAGVFKQ
jgi:hypothetical protein